MQNGLLLDEKCYDNEEQMLRTEIVTEVLQSPIIEADNETAKIRSNPNIVRLRGGG
jgi:hypothetical protein